VLCGIMFTRPKVTDQQLITAKNVQRQKTGLIRQVRTWPLEKHIERKQIKG